MSRPIPVSIYNKFSPALLFGAGTVGGWYDPSDLTTLYQDAAGTTPVTTVEQPVGLVLDKSRGLVLGSELAAAANISTNWSTVTGSQTITQDGSAVKVVGVSQGIAGANLGAVIAGKFYEVSYQIRVSAGATVPTAFTNVAIAPVSTDNSSTTYVTRRGYISPSFSNAVVLRMTLDAGEEAWITSISVRELPGGHLSQSTAAARPVLSARVNLLTKTEEFDNSVWTKTNVTGSYNTLDTTDPLGGNTADKFLETATNGGHYVDTTLGIPVSINTAYTRSVCVKSAGRQWIALDMYDTESRYTYFDVQNGIIGNIAPGTTASITPFGNGWFRCAVTRIVSQTSVFLATLSAPSNGGNVLFVGDITKGFYLWGADLRPANAGVGLPAYQRVGAAVNATTNPAVTGVPDYDTAGFPLYLKFDGTDDFLQSSTITPGADKAQVFAGYRRITSGGSLVMLSDSATNNGTFFVWPANNSTGLGDNWSVGSRGTSNFSALASGTYSAPLSNVVAAEFDISGATVRARVNATQQINNTSASQGTGNFLSYPIYVGRRNGTDLPVNGYLYSLIFRFSSTNLEPAFISQTEMWVNGKTLAFGPPTGTEIITRSADTILLRDRSTLIAR